MQVILHIGQHKTGSKALQSALYANRPQLAARGVAYPLGDDAARPLRPYEMNHYRLFASLRAAVDSAHRPAEMTALQNMLDGLVGSCPPSTETLILSAEDLFDMHTAHEAGFVINRVATASHLLARELTSRGCQVKVVCYLRRQDHLLAAHYAQFIKGSTLHSPTFVEFQTAFAPRLDAEAILSHWEKAFGVDRIVLRGYERQDMPGGIVADFFQRVLGLDVPSVREPFPDDLEAFNITPSRNHLEYMRLLNKRASRGRPVLPRSDVLESAFRDRGKGREGVAAWLSPGERQALLRRHDSGDRRIAARHCGGDALFRERVPSADDPWSAHPALGMTQLCALDAQARTIAAERLAAVPWYRRLIRVLLRWRRPRVILWVMSPEASAADEAIAVAALEEVIGCPDLESRLVPSLEPTTLLLLWPKLRDVVFVGPPSTSWREIVIRRVLARRPHSCAPR